MTPFSNQSSSLWITALFIALLGGVVAYVIHLDIADTERQLHMNLSIMVTVIVTGVLVICASSRWWLHR